METKFFKEPEWEDVDTNGHLNFSKIKKIKQKKSKKLKRKHSEIEEIDSNAGKWVRAPKYYGLEESEGEKVESPTKLKRKERKRKHKSEDEEVAPEKRIKKIHINNNDNSESKPQSYIDKLRESLKGPRFRFINEQLYTQSSYEAMKIFEEDDTAFSAYHEGYRHQISQWPMNPLDRIIKQINKMPKSHVIVDMGCGDARLSKSVVQKVYSIDLVSTVEGVIKADMAKVPLDSNSVHVIVYCLSLMGTNLKDFFLEANRLLKINGVIKIAEVLSRFEKVNLFIDFVKKCGFELVHQDLTHNLFYFFTFKKTYDVNSVNKKVPNFSLKPCLYKKR
ncbi:hypothetical protein PVAND_002077 [Polypedilum vanderplanki]|uniref:Ribosomal RNA-processing protein 8 n=1 Tax=Polypedilum vanderplanki TaxID=319348 RepID=A0A9J6BPW6_POLVA|nr:hypothetical protein PVAND_002077 [Polypedilum vanderplanki]